MKNNGVFKEQDILRRLTNVRGRDLPADKWFAEKVRTEGCIKVAYIVLCDKWLPSFVEAALLQAYYTEHRQLPPWNESF